jgi:signal transduction histidine kinase
MQGREFPPTAWLPLLAFASGICGAVLLGTSWEPLGWGMLVLGADLAWLWHRRTRSIFDALGGLTASTAGEEHGETDWSDLPHVWSNMEQENRALQEHLSREGHLHRSVMASLNMGIVLIDPRGQIVSHNPAAQRLLGGNLQVFLRGTASGLLNDPESLAMLDRAFKGGIGEWSRSRGGRTLSLYAAPLETKADQALTGKAAQAAQSNSQANQTDRKDRAGQGILLVIQDITQQEALEQTRQKFISNASHELRTPVTGIRFAAENLVDDGWIPPEGEENVKIILRNVDRMTLLLNDITELSRIETGALKLAFATVGIDPFLKDILRNADPLAKHKDVGLSLEIEAGLGDRTFTTDPFRLNQLLENLISNAIKFSPEKSTVLLDARLDGQWIVFSVRDNGPGISPIDSPRIFERFYRSQSARGIQGTGLGLAIVKHLSRIMGGEVGFESSPGKETTFFVRLPWK